MRIQAAFERVPKRVMCSNDDLRVFSEISSLHCLDRQEQAKEPFLLRVLL